MPVYHHLVYAVSHSQLSFILHYQCPRYDYFFFNDPATTEIYTLSLHDALPIFMLWETDRTRAAEGICRAQIVAAIVKTRSEEHTSELQSLTNLVCRLLLEKKKKQIKKDETWSNLDHGRVSVGR